VNFDRDRDRNLIIIMLVKRLLLKGKRVNLGHCQRQTSRQDPDSDSETDTSADLRRSETMSETELLVCAKLFEVASKEITFDEPHNKKNIHIYI